MQNGSTAKGAPRWAAEYEKKVRRCSDKKEEVEARLPLTPLWNCLNDANPFIDMKLYKIVSLSAPVEEPIGVLLTGGVVAGHQNISISTKVTSSVTLKVLSHSGLTETVLVDL